MIGSAEIVNCETESDLCDTIFDTVPHELTHEAIDHLFGESALRFLKNSLFGGRSTRWFEDGLAEYVAWQVATELAPSVAEGKMLSRSPEASLHCPEIRRKLLSWKDDLTVGAKHLRDPRWGWETNSLYGAAFQLIRLVIEQGEQSGLRKPLPSILQSLIDFRARRGRSASGEELLAIILKAVNIDVRQLGSLSLKDQHLLVSSAEKELDQKDDPEHEFHALKVLACVDSETDEKTLRALTRIAFDKASFELERRLAATALAVRMAQPGFENVLRRFLEVPGDQKSGSLDDWKKSLQSLSLRPEPPSGWSHHLGATSQTTSAQPGEGRVKAQNEFGLWGAVSFDAPTLIGKTPDARFGSFGLRYGRVLAMSKTVAFEWTIDAVPLAIVSTRRFTAVPNGPGGFTVTQTRKGVYGAGASPIGLKFNFRRNRRVQPFGSTTGGFLYFSKDVPVDGAARFNLTFDFGGGVQIINSSRRAFIIGYKYQHISNGRRSSINPGVDVQMVYAGFSIFR